MAELKTVIVADDHAFSASGVADALTGSGRFEIASLATNGIEAIAMVKNLRPDCAVFDLAMPGANGLEAFLEAKRWSPETRFAIITGSGSAAIFKELLEAGIDGLFVKSSCPEAICDGIERVASGERVISTDVQEVLDEDEKSNGERENLSRREIEVLHAIARGLTNVQSAERLGISPKTVDSHRTSLMRKMDVHTTATLLVRAMRDGLIDVTDSV